MSSNGERASILSRALQAGIGGDRETIRKLYTEDVRAWTPAHSTSSLSELMVHLDRRDDEFSDFELEVTPLDVSGEFACVEWTVSMTHSGPLKLAGGQSVGPTGLRVTLNGVTVAEFRGRQICSIRQYWDEIGVFEQLGLSPRGTEQPGR